MRVAVGRHPAYRGRRRGLDAGLRLSEPRLPDFGPLRRTRAALDAAGLAPVVGGSALLVALGAADEARDWDVVVDGDPEAVRDALYAAGIPAEPAPASATFASDALFAVDLDGTDVDVIVNFAIRSADGTVVRVPAQPGIPWNGLPMARAADWIAAYTAMGREDRAVALRAAAAGSEMG